MPDSMAITPNNTLLDVNGIDPVLRWDGSWPVMTPAGVAPPATAPNISCNANVAYGGFVTGATNASPIVITTQNPHYLVTGDQVTIADCLGNLGANGTWTITVVNATKFQLQASAGTGTYTGGGQWGFAGWATGGYEVFVRFVDRWGNYSNFSPPSNVITANGGTLFTYTNVPVPTNPNVVRRQIFRNTANQFLTFYLDVDTTNLTQTTYYSETPDTQLQNNLAQALFDTNGNSLADAYGIPPDWKPIIAQHQTRMWLAGEVAYSEGAASVQFGSATVQGVGLTEWKANWGNRFFYGADGYAPIQIASVNVATQTITLVSPWQGDDNPYMYYSVLPAPAEKNILYFSQPGLPEAWVPTNALQLPEDGYQITGLMPMGSFLYIWKQQRVYRLTDQGDPINDGFIFLAANRGCVNNRCWVIIGDMSWSLDDFGIFQFDGGKAEDISAPIQAIFRGTNRHYALNWAASRFWHAIADVNANTIRWFVTLSGDYLPYHAICYNFIAKKWWLEQYPVPIGCSAIGRVTVTPSTWRTAIQERLYVGSAAARVFALSKNSYLDVATVASGTVRGNVATAGLTWFTCASAEYGPIVGAPVTIVQGAGEGQTRAIASVVEGQINVTQPWTISLDATSVFQIGAVPWTYRTGRMTWAASEDRETRQFQLGFRPIPQRQQAIAEVYNDYDETSPVVQKHTYTAAQRRGAASQFNDPRNRLDLTRKYGTVDLFMDAQREGRTDAPRRMSMLLYGWSREFPFTIKQLIETSVFERKEE